MQIILNNFLAFLLSTDRGVSKSLPQKVCAWPAVGPVAMLQQNKSLEKIKLPIQGKSNQILGQTHNDFFKARFAWFIGSKGLHEAFVYTAHFVPWRLYLSRAAYLNPMTSSPYFLQNSNFSGVTYSFTDKCKGVGCRYWPNVKISTPAYHRL